MIELLFLAENFQCSANEPMAQFEIVVEETNGRTHTLEVGESIILKDEDYASAKVIPLANADCMAIYEYEEATVDNIPNLPGLYNQPAVSSYLDGLQDAESIYLFEFGSTGPSADFQDVILRIDWEYTNIFAD